MHNYSFQTDQTFKPKYMESEEEGSNKDATLSDRGMEGVNEEEIQQMGLGNDLPDPESDGDGALSNRGMKGVNKEEIQRIGLGDDLPDPESDDGERLSLIDQSDDDEKNETGSV